MGGFAYDFVRPHAEAGTTLEEYEAFGAGVIAPADRHESRVIDGRADLPPGESDEEQHAGGARCATSTDFEHGWATP